MSKCGISEGVIVRRSWCVSTCLPTTSLLKLSEMDTDHASDDDWLDSEPAQAGKAADKEWDHLEEKFSNVRSVGPVRCPLPPLLC